MPSENYLLLIKNVRIFLDQNIPSKVAIELFTKGYDNVFTVYHLGYAGANDGKLLKLIKDKNLLLVTYDKKFHKMAIKYHSGMSILLHNNLTEGRYGFRTIANHIDLAVQKNTKQCREYFNIEVIKGDNNGKRI
jgi:predicted nuclease of predicted toxin-antitoxin system